MERYCFGKCSCDKIIICPVKTSHVNSKFSNFRGTFKNGQSKKENNRISAEQIGTVS